MFVTERLVRQAIRNAHEVLRSVVNNYSEPFIKNIKITDATSYWAIIQKDKEYRDTYNLRVSRSFNLIPDENRAQTRLEECIIHELIHTLPKCWNHGHYFQVYAHRVNVKYPEYRVQTQTSSSEVGIKELVVKKIPKYVSTCKKCGTTSNWYRKPKYDIHMYCCSVCGGNVTLEPYVKE